MGGVFKVSNNVQSVGYFMYGFPIAVYLSRVHSAAPQGYGQLQEHHLQCWSSTLPRLPRQQPSYSCQPLYFIRCSPGMLRVSIKYPSGPGFAPSLHFLSFTLFSVLRFSPISSSPVPYVYSWYFVLPEIQDQIFSSRHPCVP